MTKKTIEAKVDSNLLKFFCVTNKNHIVGCGWYDSKYCMKSCKFYEKTRKGQIDDAKNWNR